ncbi:unnamed protein product [Orchesella dallaii]|uniref:Protein kinase domain-containing protein n=1 Tax=Orchesella dallaii TaxID=48710 RepID=A0ABP1R4P8_9HEXA
MTSNLRDLTNFEIQQFKNGEEEPVYNSVDFEMKSFLDRIQYVKYKKDEFEISLIELQMDKRTPLGSGTYGTVYRAILCRNTDTPNLPVAVKTTNALSTNVEHFKALLSELKVMTVIGNHKNIVNLIGACTEYIKTRKLYIVVELCGLGNLQAYVKGQRGTFVDLTEKDSAYIKFRPYSISIPINNDEDDPTSTKDLVKWAKEIADGMDFLESRRVVHGDLAARNVLLTVDRVAKITDFGLSRQLYNYSIYVKTQNSPLPWRWLSLEAIMDMSFSTQSDIWSYGVTLWELFQLGLTPWSEYKFCVDFVKELKHGKRLEKPTYATQKISLTARSHLVRLAFWVVFGSQIAVAVSLYLVLFKAAGQKNVRLLKIFMKVYAANILIELTTFCVYTYQFPAKPTNILCVRVILASVAKMYVTFVVYCFIKEINEEIQEESALRDLNAYELKQFENGEVENISINNLDTEIKPFLDRIQYVKYMKNEFEISLLELQLDKRAPLGSGTFGTVYKAILCRDRETPNLPVAVKTTNNLSTNVEHFKALLSELKVMTVIGNHENIVNLIGACTENIKKRKLYIVVELCAFGNIQNFLKTQRGTFLDLNDGDAECSANTSRIGIPLNTDEELTSTKDLVKWAKDIAEGMDFLESRRVIHGDLAARNVLLTEDRIAKITDFGLSRQLYNYSIYVKTQNSPLPWRWLSLEAIMDMSFSTQSDIWSYGVTLWELFQLGETPWSEYKFCLDFVKELKHGKRLEKPNYATQNIYQMMLNCWDETPAKRPTFKKLSEEFQVILLQLNDNHFKT